MSSHLPSRSDAWDLLREAEPPAWVLDHVACVESLAVAMADAAAKNGHDVDHDLVQIGAVLHDIGRADTQDPSHAHLGAERLRRLDMPSSLVDVVERHTGAGINADDAAAIGVPTKDYTPRSLEEQVIAHADNLTSGTKRLSMEQVQAKYHAKGLDDAFTRIQALHDHLCDICGTDLETLAPADLSPP